MITKDKSAERAGKVQLIDASKCSVKRRKPLGNKRNEFDETCIALITKAYNAFTDATYTDGDLVVESKVKDNEDFKFRKITVEYPAATVETRHAASKNQTQTDNAKSPKPKPEKDTEIIPWKEDVQAYMEKNVLPFQPKAKIVEKQTKIGYEIPFTREFYKYVPLEPSDKIFAHLKELEAKETELMNKILG